jgi:preprotein translocase subunit SecA
MEKEGLIGPASTWTCLMDESSDQFSRIPHIIKAAGKAFSGTLFSPRSLCKRLAAKLKKPLR